MSSSSLHAEPAGTAPQILSILWERRHLRWRTVGYVHQVIMLNLYFYSLTLANCTLSTTATIDHPFHFPPLPFPSSAWTPASGSAPPFLRPFLSAQSNSLRYKSTVDLLPLWSLMVTWTSPVLAANPIFFITSDSVLTVEPWIDIYFLPVHSRSTMVHVSVLTHGEPAPSSQLAMPKWSSLRSRSHS